MKDFYRHIDLLLVPSIGAEGFGLVIPEAAANGIPVIANRIGGIPEALGDSGILIDYNPEQDETNDIARQYVNNITALLDDGAYYETLRRRSLDWADRYKNIQMRQSQTIYETYFS